MKGAGDSNPNLRLVLGNGRTCAGYLNCCMYRWSRMDRKEMGKRTVRVGWKGREKRLDLYKQQSKVKKDELIDSKRGMHLEELSSNDGEFNKCGEIWGTLL